jgi:hypothetical protein
MTADDTERRQAARQLRAEHPKWLVIWVARTQQFHGYLLASSRTGANGLTDTESAGLAAQMEQAERAADRRAGPRRTPASST